MFASYRAHNIHTAIAITTTVNFSIHGTGKWSRSRWEQLLWKFQYHTMSFPMMAAVICL